MNKKSVGIALSISTLVVTAIVFAAQKKSAAWETYSSNDISFQYPASWKFTPCAGGKIFALPGTITGIYKTDNYPVNIQGNGLSCINNQLTAESIPINDIRKCEPHERREVIGNGLALDLNSQLFDWDDDITRVGVYVCSSGEKKELLGFNFSDPHNDSVGGEDIIKYGGEPRVSKESFLASQQYQDIKQFAESIRLK